VIPSTYNIRKLFDVWGSAAPRSQLGSYSAPTYFLAGKMKLVAPSPPAKKPHTCFEPQVADRTLPTVLT